MRRSILSGVLLVLTLLPALARGQDPFAGEFDLAGHYSTRRGTEAVLRVVRTPAGSLEVERTARFTGRAHAARPAFTWRSDEVVLQGPRTLDVVYRPGAVGIAGALGGSGPAVRHELLARYVLSPDGLTLRETVLNRSRAREQAWWITIVTSGARRLPPFAVTLDTDHPDARLERDGGLWVLVSGPGGDSASLGRTARATLRFDGQALDLRGGWSGHFSLYDLPRLVPEGYHGRQVRSDRQGDTVRTTFALGRDPAGALSAARAAGLARQGLRDFIERDRMDDRDWLDYFPGTWPELVADGIEAALDRFADLAGDTEVHREPDRFLFVGRGPYDLYTEVEVSRVDGSVTSVYVEID